MELKQLKTFIIVAETGSISAASDRLRVTQPVLSRHIKQLEAEARVPLFRRHDRGMDLTEAGLELLKRIGGTVRDLERSLEDLRPSEKPRGQVSLGLFPTLISLLAPRLVRRAAVDYPDITLRVAEAFPRQLIGQLQRAELDLALLIGPSADLHLRTVDLLYEEFLVLGPPNGAAPTGRALSLAELGTLPLIMPTADLRSGNPVVAAAERARVKLQIAYEIDSLPLTFDLVESGLGYTVAPVSAISHPREKSRFSTFRLEEPVQRHLILARPTSRAETRATTAVANLIVAEIADLVGRGEWQAVPDAGLRRAR